MMNENTIKGEWKKMKGKVKEQWGKLTNDDLDKWEGRAEQLSGSIQKIYGRSKEAADQEVDEFYRRNKMAS